MCLSDKCQVDPMCYPRIRIPSNPQQQWRTVLTFSGSNWDRLGLSLPKQPRSYPENPDIMASLGLQRKGMYEWIYTQVSMALTFKRTLTTAQATGHRDPVCSSQSQPSLAAHLSRSQTTALQSQLFPKYQPWKMPSGCSRLGGRY